MELERRSPNSSMLKTSLSKNSVPRSPLPRSPMPKSPFPYSPVPKSPELYEKYKSRCVYSLISFFHFRQGHSKKLISDADKKTLKKISHGDGYIQNRFDLHSDNSIHDGAQKKTPMMNSGYAKVKKIKGEDVSIDLQKKKKITTAKVENIQSDSQRHDGRPRSPRKSTKSRRTRRLPIYGCYDVSTMDHGDIPNQTLAESDQSAKSLDSAISAEVQVCNDDNIMQHDRPSEINLQVNINEATEAFINQKLIDGKHLIADGESHRSKDLLDALKILNSNKDLFVKLLQDPNSLLVKHIEELRDSQEKKQQIKMSTKAELSKFQTRNTRECTQPLEKIVVVRPNSKRLENCADSNDDSSHAHYSLRSVEQSVKPVHFSFEQMKRKLMHAIRVSRKEQQVMLIDNRLHDKPIHDFEVHGLCGEETVLGSANSNSSDESSSDFEGMIKPSIGVNKEDKMDNEGQFVTVIRDNAVSACESSKENSHRERNEHCVDINSGFRNENTNLLKREDVKISDSKLLPEHDLLHVVSPGMRFSSYCYHHIAIENNWNQKERTNSCSRPVRQKEEAVCTKQMQEHETSNGISSNCFRDNKEHEIISLLSNDSSHKEKACIENSEESIHSVPPSQPDGLPNNYINQSSEMVDSCEDSGSLDFSREDSPIKNQTSTSSIDDYSYSPLKNQRFEAFDMNKQTEQPSPVSVLDKFMADDINNSPSNTEPVIADPPSIPLPSIGIKEGCLATSTTDQSQLSLNNINSSISTEEYKPAFEYVTALLQACHFDWDELRKKYNFSDQLFDQSLLSDKLVHPNEFSGDHGLLFDYVNEVTVDVCRCYLKCSRWLSFLKPRILSATMTENIANEVVKNFDWNLLLAQPSLTLGQIFEKDLMKSRTWMDVRIDAEDAVSEMIDSILEELMIDFAVE